MIDRKNEKFFRNMSSEDRMNEMEDKKTIRTLINTIFLKIEELDEKTHLRNTYIAFHQTNDATVLFQKIDPRVKEILNIMQSLESEITNTFLMRDKMRIWLQNAPTQKHRYSPEFMAKLSAINKYFLDAKDNLIFNCDSNEKNQMEDKIQSLFQFYNYCQAMRKDVTTTKDPQFLMTKEKEILQDDISDEEKNRKIAENKIDSAKTELRRIEKKIDSAKAELERIKKAVDQRIFDEFEKPYLEAETNLIKSIESSVNIPNENSSEEVKAASSPTKAQKLKNWWDTFKKKHTKKKDEKSKIHDELLEPQPETTTSLSSFFSRNSFEKNEIEKRSSSEKTLPRKNKIRGNIQNGLKKSNSEPADTGFFTDPQSRNRKLNDSTEKLNRIKSEYSESSEHSESSESEEKEILPSYEFVKLYGSPSGSRR